VVGPCAGAEGYPLANGTEGSNSASSTGRVRRQSAPARQGCQAKRLDSPPEESGFEPSVPPCERVGLSGRNANASQATRMVSNASAM